MRHDQFALALQTRRLADRDVSDTGDFRQLALAYSVEELCKILSDRHNILIYFWQASAALQDKLHTAAEAEWREMFERFSRQEMQGLINEQGLGLVSEVLSELKPSLEAFLSLLPKASFQFTAGRTQSRMCPLFHVDNVQLRFFVTLRGPGTQWLLNTDVNRSHLGKGTNRKILRHENVMIQELQTFQVGLLKGERYPGNMGKGIVHRSPAVPDHLSSRWFIRVDAHAKYC